MVLAFPVNYTSQKALAEHPVASAYTAVPPLAEAPDAAVSPPAPVAGQTVPVAASSAPLPGRERNPKNTSTRMGRLLLLAVQSGALS